MRAVSKNFDRPPIGLSPNNLSDVIDTANPNHKKLIRQSIYANPSVVDKLTRIYNYKCAYCESYEPEPEVEHYRPKKGVTDEVHAGYFWLCYEWSNLLPSCHDCNKTRSKGNHFPVEGIRQTSPVMTGGTISLNDNRLDSQTLSSTEIPLLLNPEFPGFDPFLYFKIDSIGKIIPAPFIQPLAHRKAKTTIDKIRLNRDKLLLSIRKREIRYYMGRVKILLYKYLNGKCTNAQYEGFFCEILKEIKAKGRVTKTSEYWFFWNYFFLNFKDFLSSYFKPRLRPGLFQTYDAMILLV